MPGRIITAQRSLGELGRLRSGYYDGRPIRSKTWILTGALPEVMEAAAEEWGGKVEKWTPLNGKDEQLKLVTDTDLLPAWLPPADPLSQANELWNRGGAVRRCDGVTEKFSGKSCLCLAEFGEEWFREDKKVRCQPYSHLNILLLQLPDLGQWRHTTKSYYAAGEIATRVDFIKRQVGNDDIVPIWIGIDHREKVAGGKTTPYPVPFFRIRGAGSAMEQLTGSMPTLQIEADERRQHAVGGASSLPALPSAPAVADAPADPTPLTVERVVRMAAAAKTLLQIQQLWKDASDADILATGNLRAILKARGDELDPNRRAPAAEPAVEEEAPVDADDTEEPDAEGVWMQINALAGKRKWSSADLEQRVCAYLNRSSDEANGWQLDKFLTALKSGQVA
jgi:hypothetical protein